MVWRRTGSLLCPMVFLSLSAILSSLEWFATVDLLDGLPAEFGRENILESHINKLKSLQSIAGVEPTSLYFSYGFLRDVASEIKAVQNEALQNFLRIVGLSERGITFEQFRSFAESWNKDLRVLTTLAVHYQKVYPNGLPLMGSIIESLIKGNYEDSRYNLNDELIRKQLAPILDGLSPAQQQEALKKWRSTFPKFKTVQGTRGVVNSFNPEAVRNELLQRLTSEGHSHINQIFTLEELGSLPEDKRSYLTTNLERYIKGDKEAINFGQFMSELSPYLPKDKVALLIGITQFYKDLFTPNKSIKEISSSFERLVNNIQAKWPELYNLEMVSLDLVEYLKPELSKGQGPQITVVGGRTYLSYLTDHPKTLLEIGKYPNSSSCQNYESVGILNQALLGYVFDSHIKAACVTEVDLTQDISENVLNQATVEMDEGRRLLKLSLPNGDTVSARYSRPVARNIVMLGRKEDVPYLIVEPAYLGNVDDALANELLNQGISAAQGEFQKVGINLELAKEKDPEIEIAGSHNPVGHYNDIAGSTNGADGEPYALD